MDQTTARRRAEELGGIAVGARWSEAKGKWVLGGYSPHPEWVVVDINQTVVLDDGGKWPADKPWRNEVGSSDSDFTSRQKQYEKVAGILGIGIPWDMFVAIEKVFKEEK